MKKSPFKILLSLMYIGRICKKKKKKKKKKINFINI